MTKDTNSEQKRNWRKIFNQVVLLFLIGCIFGTYYEEIITIFKNFWGTGQIIWESRRGLLYGPFSPVYGIGAVLIYLVFYLPKLKWWQCLGFGALFGGALEFGLSVVQEWMFGTISWDYSDRWLNIAGRTTIPYMVFWGILVTLLARWLCPWLDEIYKKLPEKNVNLACAIIAAVLMADIGISLLAAARQSARRAGDPADNPIEVVLDKYYDDGRTSKTYRNTRVAE